MTSALASLGLLTRRFVLDARRPGGAVMVLFAGAALALASSPLPSGQRAALAPAHTTDAPAPRIEPVDLGPGAPLRLAAAGLSQGHAIAAALAHDDGIAVRVAIVDHQAQALALTDVARLSGRDVRALALASAGEALALLVIDDAGVPTFSILDDRGVLLADASAALAALSTDPILDASLTWNPVVREWLLVWRAHSDAGIALVSARFDAWGIALDAPTTITTGRAVSAAPIVPLDAGSALAWRDESGTISAARQDALGTPRERVRFEQQGLASDAPALIAIDGGDDALIVFHEPATDDAGPRFVARRAFREAGPSTILATNVADARLAVAAGTERVRLAWVATGDDGRAAIVTSVRRDVAMEAGHDEVLASLDDAPLAMSVAAGAASDLVAWIEPATSAGDAARVLATTLGVTTNDADAAPETDAKASGSGHAGLSPVGTGGSPSLLACGGPRYVAPTGSDAANDCRTLATPCRTISHAVVEACAGETVNVALGTYNEDVVIDKAITVDASGSSVGTQLVGTGAGDVVTILSGGAAWDGVEVSGAPNHACLRVGNATAVGLRNVSVRNAAFYGCAVGVIFENTGAAAGSSTNRILSIDARDNVTSGTDTSGVGVLLRGGNGRLEIKTSFLRNNQGIGLLVEAPTGGRTNDALVITGNRFINNGFSALAPRRSGMEIDTATNARIEGNRVREHDGVGAGADDGRGFVLSNVTGGNFDCNNFEENDTGLVLTGGSNGFPILHNRFVTHGYTALRTEAGSASTIAINESIFSGNVLAVDHSGDGTLNARHSWWGAPNGPAGAGGSGNPIQGAIDVGNFIPRSVAPILVRRPVDSGWSPSQAACRDTIQSAVNAAVNGDLLVIGKGVYREKVTVTGKTIDLEGITGGAGCSTAEIDAEQTGGSHLPALRISNVSGINVSNLTIRSAGEGTVCGQATGDEIGLDLQNVSTSNFRDLCFRENGVTEIRVFGNSDGNLFERIDIEGVIRAMDGSDECGHRSREGILIDGGPSCEGGAGAIASGNRIVDVTMDFVTRGVSLKLADATEISSSTIAASSAPAWDAGLYSVGVLVALSDDVRIEGNAIGNAGETEGVRIAGRDASSCVTERLDTLRTIVTGNSITDATGAGIKLHRATSDPGAPRATDISCNEFLRNGVGIRADFAGFGADANLVGTNDFRTNATGIRNDGLETLDARDNWWNSVTGPGGAGGGSGDSIFGAVTFSPFLSSSALIDNDADLLNECAGDCDDTRASVYPGAPEICDALDNDCDASVDEGLPLLTYFRDADGDGRGNAAVTTQVCTSTPPLGYVTNSDDCNDGDPLTFPGAPEVTCDGIDQGCDGPGDEAPDADADGYDVCDASDPGDQDGLAGDCADANYDRNPNTPEIACDGIDNDCDGTIDVPGLACGDLAVTNLRFAPGSKRALTWSSAPAADAYAMHRGTIEPAGMRGYDHRCAGAELPTPGAEDHDVPPLGSAYYYLATGVSIDSGSGSFDNGPLGVDSAGIARPDSVSVQCGARVYVDPDALAGNGTGLSWADAYTTVSGALRHSRGKSRALTVWMRGVVADETSLLTGGAAYRGLRVLGGFSGAEAREWERDPAANPTTWRESNGARLVDARGRSVLIDGVRIDAGSTGIYAELDRGALVELHDVIATGLTAQLADVSVVGPGGGRLVASDLDVDGSGQQAIRAIARAGTLDGSVRDSVFAGGSDAALRLEARGENGAAIVDLALLRLTVSGGRVGVVLGAHATDAGFDAQQISTLASSLVRGTSEEGVRIESTGSFSTLGAGVLARNTAVLTGNTISDAGAEGVAVVATRTDSTGSSALHRVESTPALWGNLLTWNGGAALEESTDDVPQALVADPLLIANGLFGNAALYLDEGTTTRATIGEVNALGANAENFDLDPLFVDRVAGNYRLQANSPAIDRGRLDAPALATEDRDGAPRLRGGAPDAGAYEALP